MPIPPAEPGLVISYAFLWSHEHDHGDAEGRKRRPCAVVLAIRTEAGRVTATVAPITHSPPRDADAAVEIPPRVKDHLGLDAARSWIILDELNEFVWPGVDIYPVPGGRPGQFHYGFLPPLLYEKVRKAILALDSKRKRTIRRDEDR